MLLELLLFTDESTTGITAQMNDGIASHISNVADFISCHDE